MTTKRVYELEVDDTFFYYGVGRRVTYIGKGRVFYKPMQFESSGARDSFGAKSNEKVEYTGKWVAKIKTKPKVYA